MADNTPVSIKNRMAVVTGGSSGIGKALVDQLLHEGARVVNADIKDPVDNPGTNRPPYYFYKTDGTSVEQVQQLYGCVKHNAGSPNLLVCNAGSGIHEKLAKGDPDQWARLINFNLLGSLRLLRNFLPGIQSAGNGHDGFISSVSFKNPYTYGGIYAPAKAAKEMIAETLWLEMKEQVKVTVISPGVVDTSFLDHM